MANLVEVFTQEWDRENPAEWNKIHLYKMGDFAELIEYDADMQKGWLKAA